MRCGRCGPLLPLILAGVLAACGPGEPRGSCNPRPAAGTVGSVCGFRNPEDVELLRAAGVLAVSQMAPIFGEGAGSLAAVTLESLERGEPDVWTLWPDDRASEPTDAPLGDRGCTTPPAANRFAPHGMASATLGDGTTRLAVVSHAPREAVEIFEVAGSGRGTALRWRGCVPLPLRASGNDLALRPDGTLVVANYQPAFGGFTGALWMLAASAGVTTGDVLQWMPARGWSHLPGTAARGANGVAVAEGRASIWFAETGAARIGRLEGGEVVRAPIEGAPDNLAWTSRGTLVTTTHLSPLAFLRCGLGERPCRAPWALVAIDPATLATTELLRHDGSAVGAATGAVEVGGRFYLGAVFDDRLGVWSNPH